MDLKVSYLLNSGFAVRVKDTMLLFDDYRDPAGIVQEAWQKEGIKNLYVFVSHAHFDHFDIHILDYAPHVVQYIFGYDVRNTRDARKFPSEKTTFMETYSSWEDGNIAVKSYDSTDAGVSFLIVLKDCGIRIFHAGDFNWWDWADEDDETRKLAENAFKKQMKRLSGLSADIVFFPVDGRLGASRTLGVKAFLQETDVRNLIAMHSVGFPVWVPEPGFFRPGKEISVWMPEHPGETKTYSV